MLQMEKTLQIGELVQARSEQKKNLAHLKLRSDKIAAAYSAFAAQRARWQVDAGSPEQVFLKEPTSTEREHPSYLLSQRELAAHVREVVEIEQELAETNFKLKTLGIED